MEKTACLALTTCPSIEQAQTLATVLVEQRLAACVNIIPGMTSVYRWQDEVEQAQECQLVIKTQQALVSQVYDCVIQRHPYDVPEWLIIEVSDGLTGEASAYLKWLNDSLKK